jgi:cytochrome c-type biogenesis protein CcmH/NrfG
VVYSNLRRWEEAAACYRRAIALAPNRAEAHRNLGSVLREAGRVEEGVSAIREALRLDPNFAEVWASLGLALVEADDPETALTSCQRAIELNPRLVAAHHHHGVALFDLGRRQEALDSYSRALALEPNLADAHKNRALLWLIEGKLTEGWDEYEWRWKCAESPPPLFGQPLWDGSPLAGRTILLHAEQGLGDTIQFVRYATLVRRRGGRVVLLCQPALVSLVRRCEGVEQVVAQGDRLPPFDLHAPLMSLPRIFGTTLDTIPSDTPYLDVDPRSLERWRDELAGDSLFKVGIAWQGSRLHRRDRGRSIPLTCFQPLAALPGVQLYSLQTNEGREQIALVDFADRIVDLSPRVDSFAETAAAIANLDLVISCDTSVAHLAGALGKPAWVAIRLVPDWRWLLDRDDSPWYPTLRLFRQTRRGDWGEVMERVAQRLARSTHEYQFIPPTTTT